MGRLTLWGMEQAYPDLLEGIQVPGNMSRNDLVQILNARVGAQYPYIQVPPVLKVLISSWFVTRQETFQRMYDAMWAEYDPIENYDRKEDRELHLKHSGIDTDTSTLGSKVTVTHTGTETQKSTGQETTQQTGSETTKETGTEKTNESGTETSTSTGTDTTKRTGTEGDILAVSAFDASSYVPRENRTRTPDLTDTRTPDLTDIRTPDLETVRTPDLETVRSPNLTQTRIPELTQKRTPDLTDVSQNSGTDSRLTEYGHNEDTLEKIRAHGNVGVTTNQQMITAEMDMRAMYNLYDIIIQMFEAEFMSRVY